MISRPKFFDAHTHAHFAAFKDDWRDVISRALDKGVHMINVGTQRDTSRAAVETARAFDAGVYAAVGLHPVHTDKSFHDAQELGGAEGTKGFTSRGEEFDAAYYRELALDPKTVAIGECGLDYFRIEGEVEEKKSRQKSAFEAQLALAREVDKPLMVHCRAAFPDLVDILTANRDSLPARHPGVIHFFSGTEDEAKKLLDLGFGFTFGGVVTFARDYDRVIKMLPLDRILSETDAPYVSPEPYRGKRNEPAYVAEVVKKLAEIREISPEAMAEATAGNALDIFLGGAIIKRT
jgi:TatD DNase family protein